ncbi:Na+/H+ antiporter subunit D [Nibricoccus sp. IMCC34717]|uniref:Na+/H+ antiporter subunit D n=1 Tax=Nibricoccus sp. IMCC34717 TaxID=3034021 RepID=UPI0038511BFD
MSDVALLIAPLLLPFATAVTAFVLRGQIRWQRAIGLAGSLVSLVAAVLLVGRADAQGHVVIQAGGWAAPFGITLVADRLAALMVAVSAFVGAGVSLYSWQEDLEDETARDRIPLVHALLMGVQGSFITGDLFNLYVWFEVMLMASFVLLTLGNRAGQLEGAIKYVILNVVASTLFLIGAGLLYGKIGTLNLADIAERLAKPEQAGLVATTGVLFLVAFGLKAGMFPFFFWLPASYHTPRPAVSALFAGLLTKVGVYVLMRAYTLFLGVQFPALQTLLLVVAAITMLTGVLGAAAHFDIRRILSFHIISQIGYMLLGLALMTPLALAGTVFYLLHHIVVKTNLFFVGGIVERLQGTGELEKIGGLWRQRPGLSLLFLVPALSLGGIPPLSGFWAKLALIDAGLRAHAWAVTAVALGVGLLTLFSMTKIWAEAFWKALPEGQDLVEQPIGVSAATVVVLFALVTVLLGLAGGPVFEFSLRAAAQLLDPGAYIAAVRAAGGPLP